MEFQLSYFNPKRWCCESAAFKMPANLENWAVAPGLKKVSFHSNPKEGQCQRMFKLLYNGTHLTHLQSNAQNSPSQASMVYEQWTSRCSSWFWGTRDQIANIHWITEKAREFQNNIYFCLIDYAKAFDYVDHTNCGKFFKRWEYQTTLPASWQICMQVKKQQLEPDMEQWTGFKLGCMVSNVKTIYYHLAYLTYMESISCKMLSLMKHKLESRLPGEI